MLRLGFHKLGVCRFALSIGCKATNISNSYARVKVGGTISSMFAKKMIQPTRGGYAIYFHPGVFSAICSTFAAQHSSD